MATPWLLRRAQGRPWPLLLTGNVPSERMWASAFSMSGMLMDSAQSQSRRPSFMGSLWHAEVSWVHLAHGFRSAGVWLAHSLVLGPVKIILVQHEAVWEYVSEQPGEGRLAARGAAGQAHDDCFLAAHLLGGVEGGCRLRDRMALWG